MKITSDAQGISKDTEELLKMREIEAGLKKQMEKQMMQEKAMAIVEKQELKKKKIMQKAFKDFFNLQIKQNKKIQQENEKKQP